MDMRDQILHLENVISELDCKKLVMEYESRKEKAVTEKCLHANTGINTESTFKKVELKPISYTHNLIFRKTEFMINEWVKKLEQFQSFHIPSLKDWYLKCSHQYRLMKYEPGGWIHPHIDGSPIIYASCTFQLNDEFTGGEFWFWNGKHKIKLRQGDGLIFPAGPFWVHEVRNIDTGARYSVNSFILSAGPELHKNIENLTYSSLAGVKTYKVL